jgi:hypothetical protein
MSTEVDPLVAFLNKAKYAWFATAMRGLISKRLADLMAQRDPTEDDYFFNVRRGRILELENMLEMLTSVEKVV